MIFRSCYDNWRTSMGKSVTPSIFLIAETNLVESGIRELKEALGITDWDTDAASPAEWLTEFAGKSCYMSFDLRLNQNLTSVNTRANAEYVRSAIIGHHHGSVLEHSTVTLFLKDVSRVVTHELVRHRVGTAYSQTSGRYVRVGEVDYYVPRCIAENSEALAVFVSAFETQETASRALADIFELDHMRDFVKKKEVTSAIRRIIGNGQAANIVVTGNHRSWRHMIALRTAPGAEEEIRLVFVEIAGWLAERYPSIYADMSIDDDGVCTFVEEKV